MTSHDVVDMVRRALGTRKVGHAGTLDPMATGLLDRSASVAAPGCCGSWEISPRSTKARHSSGVETTTLDADGEVTEERPVKAS